MNGQKGIVMEKGENWAIVLLENGEFKKIRSAEPLQEGQIYQHRSHPVVRYAVAAVFLLSIIAGTMDYFSIKAYAEILSLADIGVNRWGRVISVTAVSDEGQNMLNTIDLKNDQLDQAVEKIVTQAIDQGITPVDVQGTVRGEDHKSQEKLLKQVNQGIDKASQNTHKKIPQTKNSEKDLTHKDLKDKNNKNETSVQTPASSKENQGQKKDENLLTVESQEQKKSGFESDHQNSIQNNDQTQTWKSSLNLPHTNNTDKTWMNQKDNSNQANKQEEKSTKLKEKLTREKAHNESVNQEKEK